MSAMTMSPLTLSTPTEYTNPFHEKFREQLPLLLKDLDATADGLAVAPMGDSEPYVNVVAQWWGLVFVLSPQATTDLATGAAAAATVAGAIAGLCAANPAIALGAGVISAMFALYGLVYTAMNRGNGIYITALWPSIAIPAAWIPTPR